MVKFINLPTALLATLLLSSLATAKKHKSGPKKFNNDDTSIQPDVDSWEGQVLSQTNFHRAHHGAPPLTWSTSMQAFAQSWVNGCVFKHSGNPQYGENIWAEGSSSSSPNLNGTAPVDDWYNEVQYYNWNEPGNLVGPQGQEIGHFTALVWESSTQVGCAQANCPMGTIWPK
ncbi:CAP domain-containing protein [Endogone sp. FLAS-F59071]|nr:CAP domain-containing protein [Endogone sp. FLAS-F59071]|eukprot:RUS21492.1 CAP domain-containing protein [Endogone sp. FLAS-F59071]